MHKKSLDTGGGDTIDKRKNQLSDIFESVLEKLGYAHLSLQEIERCIILPNGEIRSKAFTETIHSELIAETGNNEAVRGVLLRTNAGDILLAYTTERKEDLPHNLSQSFLKIITGEDIKNSGNQGVFASYVREIIDIETSSRNREGRERTTEDEDIIRRAMKILNTAE